LYTASYTTLFKPAPIEKVEAKPTYRDGNGSQYGRFANLKLDVFHVQKIQLHVVVEKLPFRINSIGLKV
jgi:hypothetical protein